MNCDCRSEKRSVERRSSTKPIKLMKWNEETTQKFVQLYKENACLWNTHLPEYRDKYRRYFAYQNMADEMALPNFCPREVRRKIKILRTTYYQEVLKVEESKVCGDGMIYKPTLKWFHVMDEILRNLVHKRQNLIVTEFLTEDNPMTEAENGRDLLLNVTDTIEKGPLSTDNVFIKSEPLTEDTLTFDNVYIKSEPMKHSNIEIQHRSDPIFQKETTCSNRANLRDIRRALKRKRLIRKHLLKLKRKKRIEDEFLIFGKHVAAQLRTLDEEECIAAEQEIQSVLSQARLRTIQKFDSDFRYKE